MGIKYSMEGFIKLEARVYRSQCKREKSHITVADDDMQDQHCSCITGYD